MALKVEDRAPGFEVEVLSESGPEGWPSRVSLDSLLRRGPAVLSFVKETCGTCRFALPFLNRVFLRYPDSRVSLAVMAQEAAPAARRMVRELKLQLPVLLDSPPYPVSRAYRVDFVPTFYWVTGEGRIGQVVEAFRSAGLESLNARVAELAGVAGRDLFGPEEGVPEFRPG